MLTKFTVGRTFIIYVDQIYFWWDLFMLTKSAFSLTWPFTLLITLTAWFISIAAACFMKISGELVWVWCNRAGPCLHSNLQTPGRSYNIYQVEMLHKSRSNFDIEQKLFRRWFEALVYSTTSLGEAISHLSGRGQYFSIMILVEVFAVIVVQVIMVIIDVNLVILLKSLWWSVTERNSSFSKLSPSSTPFWKASIIPPQPPALCPVSEQQQEVFRKVPEKLRRNFQQIQLQ